MKQIEPIKIWKNGQNKTASVLEARIINDDLNSNCTFYYELREANSIVPSQEEGVADSVISGSRLAEGNVSMTGQDYLDWDGSNETAYEHVANSINVEIVIE